MRQRKVVKVKCVERTVYEKRIDSVGEKYECLVGCDERNGKLIGWRTEEEAKTYQMPIETFLEHAQLVE